MSQREGLLTKLTGICRDMKVKPVQNSFAREHGKGINKLTTLLKKIYNFHLLCQLYPFFFFFVVVVFVTISKSLLPKSKYSSWEGGHLQGHHCW